MATLLTFMMTGQPICAKFVPLELGEVREEPLADRSQSMPVGVVVRCLPGVTGWVQKVWKPVSILPGAGPAEWRLLREEDGASEYHAATVPLELHRTETDAYLVALAEEVPCVYVVLRENEDPDTAHPYEVLLVTASPYEGQDYADTAEEIVEKVPMPDGVIAWINQFVEAHHEEEEFVKRRRVKKRIDSQEDGIGDARISQLTDVYRSPSAKRRSRLH